MIKGGVQGKCRLGFIHLLNLPILLTGKSTRLMFHKYWKKENNSKCKQKILNVRSKIQKEGDQARQGFQL